MSGKLDRSVNQWFCDTCWGGYEAGDGGGSGPNAIPILNAEEDARVERLAAMRAAALQKLGVRTQALNLLLTSMDLL